jgi:F420 biosynthesis protein FbiB-like protein
MRDGPENLAWLCTRRSIRKFSDRPVDRAMLQRVLEAAASAPSSTNRQPWRFAVITAASLRQEFVDAVRARTDELRAVIARGHHAEEFGSYGDFFWEPLHTASVIVVPQYRELADLLANFIASAGEDPLRFETTAPMHPEICATSAAVMALLLQAHAEGLGACWMAGPMVARSRIEERLGIRQPWHMLGAVALGHPAEKVASGPQRRPLERIVEFYE